MAKAAFLLFVATALAAALPEPAATTTTAANLFCTVVDDLVTLAHAQSTATAYCSSYLSITTVTATVPAATTVAVFPESFSCASSMPSKRNPGLEARTTKTTASSVAKPSCFSTFTLSSLISSACSCLQIPTPTSTTSVPATTTVTSFIIEASAASETPGYALLLQASGGGYEVSFTGTTPTNAQIFNFQGNCVPGTGKIQGAYVEPLSDGNDPMVTIASIYAYEVQDGDGAYVECSIGLDGPSQGTLSCVVSRYVTGINYVSTIAGTNNLWHVGDGSVGTVVDLTVYPA